VIQTELTDAA